MAASCAIVSIESTHGKTKKGLSYDYLYKFWETHYSTLCTCVFCSQSIINFDSLTTEEGLAQVSEISEVAGIKMNFNPPLLINQYPSLLAPSSNTKGTSEDTQQSSELNAQSYVQLPTTEDTQQSSELSAQSYVQLPTTTDTRLVKHYHDSSQDNCDTTSTAKAIPVNKEQKCPTCSRFFRQKKTYQRHLTECKLVYTCHCGRTFTHYRYLKTHQSRVHSEQQYICEECKKTFSTVSALKRHEKRMHTPVHDRIPCMQCEKTFGDKRSLHRHIQTHGVPDKKYPCSKCEVGFQNQWNLKRHMRMQHIKKTLKCVHCDTYLDSIHSWRQHIEDHPKKRYCCTECPMSFNKKNNLARHAMGHSGQKSFHCSLCDKSFQLKQSLEFHQMQRHSNTRPYKCPTCDKRFSRKVLLDSHTASHGPRNFACPLKGCTSSYSKRSTLHCHIASRHNQYFVKSWKYRATSRSLNYKLIRQERSNEQTTSVCNSYNFNNFSELLQAPMFTPQFSDIIEPME